MKRVQQTTVSKNLPNRLRKLRISSGWSQEEAAQQLRIDRRRISKYERGEILPTADILVKFAEVFEVSLDYLLRDNISENKKPDFDSIKDKEMFNRLQKIDTFPDEDKKALVSIMDLLIKKNSTNDQ